MSEHGVAKRGWRTSPRNGLVFKPLRGILRTGSRNYKAIGVYGKKDGGLLKTENNERTSKGCGGTVG